MPGIMETAALSAANRRPRTRQSISNTSDLAASGMEDKENATVDLSSLVPIAGKPVRAAKKLRSKSLGPGGLEALKETSGNRRKVGLLLSGSTDAFTTAPTNVRESFSRALLSYRSRF